MKIEVCTDKKHVLTSIELTRKDIEERAWAKYIDIELNEQKSDSSSTYECYMWRSDDHSEGNIILEYEYIEGYLTNCNIDISKLESDSEWKETIDNLKKFALSMLNKDLNQ